MDQQKRSTVVAVALWGLLWAQPLRAQSAAPDLTKLSLEELMNVEVTSATKREQKLSSVAAAIYVISQEDIRRSGAINIPEALRMVPGIEVARIDSNKWAISARGFNSFFANKLLVLLDGRNVYTPLFSGVLWDVQDTLLEDIDRIEVVRGPAGTLWGANAVNGVINIITKKAAETQGGLLEAGGGNEERGFGALRYGGKIGADTYFRVFGKYFGRDNFTGGVGGGANDAWHMGRGGLRVDSALSAQDSLTIQGDYYNGNVGTKVLATSVTPPFESLLTQESPVSGGNLLARWKRALSPTAALNAQFYYDRTERVNPLNKESRNTVDFEAQHSFAPALWHQMIWGIGYRYTQSSLKNTFTLSFDPEKRADHLFSAFLQSDFTLIEDHLRLTLGSKFEHNNYTEFEIQPNVRLTWMVNSSNTLWAAISRAVRTPSQFEHDVRANLMASLGPASTCPLPALCVNSFFGRNGYGAEDLIAYEIGYRSQIGKRLSFDMAAFYNSYDDLRSMELGSPFIETNPLPPHLVIPITPANKLNAQSYGVELAAKWSPTDYWKLALGYTFLKLNYSLDRSSTSSLSASLFTDSAENRFHIRSYLDLPYNFSFDTAVYYVDRLSRMDIPSYTRVDLRLGYSPIKTLDISVGWQNLFDKQHREFGELFIANPTKIERSIYGKLTWRF